MRFVVHAIEQLDLAARQLEHRNPPYSRFALILVDNAVELLLHRWCEFELHRPRRAAHLTPSAYTENDRRAALGQRFEDKPKFCHKAGFLTEPQRDFILACHTYRNELYHRGLSHESLLGPLASEYFLIACTLLSEHRYSSYSYGPGQVYSDAVMRHIGTSASSGAPDMKRILFSASRSLLATMPASTTTLQDALSGSLLRQLDSLSSALASLSRTPNGRSPYDEVLHDLESYIAWFVHFPSRADAAELNLDENFARYHDERRAFQAAYKQTFFSASLDRWKERSDQVAHEKDVFLALKKHETIKREMEPFAEMVFEAEAALESHIQSEIDSLRGK